MWVKKKPKNAMFSCLSIVPNQKIQRMFMTMMKMQEKMNTSVLLLPAASEPKIY